METSSEALSTRKIVIMIAVVCIVGVFVLDRPVHDNGSVRSFIRQMTDQVSTDILNGIPVTNARDFSSVVGITATPTRNPTDVDGIGCTGVLLSRTDVLTAGHCCDSAFGFTVHAGLAFGQNPLRVRDVEVMPGYRYDRTLDANNQTIETPEKDLCMITLENPVNFRLERIYVSQTKPRLGELVDIVGFGMIGRDTDSGDRLYYARTAVASCKRALSWALNKATVFNDIVCAGHASTSRRAAQNACSGDSGGPMLSQKLPNEDARKLFGILSDGNKPCETGTNSYTDVTKTEFRNFIAHYSGATWMPICNRRPL